MTPVRLKPNYAQLGRQLLLGVLLYAPMVTVVILSPDWPRTAPKHAPGLLALSGGAYACLFFLGFSVLPRWIEVHRAPDKARGWRYAALKAALCSAAPTFIFLVGHFPVGPYPLRIGLTTLAMVFFYTLLGWLVVRYFPESSWPWRRWR